MSDKIRPAVQAFAYAMEKTLQKHDEERGEDGWLHDCDVRGLIDFLDREIKELKQVFNDCSPADVLHECTDVGNFAMMIYSKILRDAPEYKDHE